MQLNIRSLSVCCIFRLVKLLTRDRRYLSIICTLKFNEVYILFYWPDRVIWTENEARGLYNSIRSIEQHIDRIESPYYKISRVIQFVCIPVQNYTTITECSLMLIFIFAYLWKPILLQGLNMFFKIIFHAVSKHHRASAATARLVRFSKQTIHSARKI